MYLAGSWQGAGPGGPNQKLTSSNDHLRREQGEQDDDDDGDDDEDDIGG